MINNLPPAPRSTAGFAQPADYGGAEQCSTQPRLRPLGGGDGGSSLRDSMSYAAPGSGRPFARRRSPVGPWGDDVSPGSQP
jgi:hypothetical protein